MLLQGKNKMCQDDTDMEMQIRDTEFRKLTLTRKNQRRSNVYRTLERYYGEGVDSDTLLFLLKVSRGF